MNPENNFEFVGVEVGAVDLSYFQAVVNLELARAFLALEEGAAPEGYSLGSRNESEGGGRGSGGPRGVFVLGGEGAV